MSPFLATRTRVPTTSPGTAPEGLVHRVDPARRLPGGRAVLGGVLVAVAGLGLFAAARPPDTTPTTSYLVARRAISPGHRLASSDLSMVPIDLPGSVAGEAMTDLEAAVGTLALQPIPSGTIITRHDVATGDRTRSLPLLSFAIASDRAAGGDLVAGDRIDVLVTWTHTADGDTEVVGHDLAVVSVDRPSNDALGGDAKIAVSINVPRGKALVRLTRAVRSGELTIVRTTGAR